MKRVLPILPVLAFLTTVSLQSKAQVSVSVNIGAQPMWAPAGYASADYYYLPDIECYYYVPQRQFVYLNGPNWEFSYNLPARCRGYDLYSGYKVVCSGPRPYRHFYDDRVTYARYRGYRNCQPVVRDCGPRDGYYERERYYDGPRGHGNGHGYGHYKDRGYEGRGYEDHGYEGHGRGHGHHGW